MDIGWLAAGTAILSFFGAILGSLVTGYIVEHYRQKNRLQLAAIDKRLEAYQEGYSKIVLIGAKIITLQDQKQPAI